MDCEQTLGQDDQEDRSKGNDGKQLKGLVSGTSLHSRLLLISMVTPKDDGNGRDGLPFPESYPVAHETPQKVVYYDIHHMNLPVLQNLCGKYNLKPKERKKQAYIKLLQEFSQKKEAWTASSPNCRPHKGPDFGGKRKLELGSPRKPKLSTIRWEQSQATQNLTLAAGSDSATQFQVQNDLSQWATRLVTSSSPHSEGEAARWKNTQTTIEVSSSPAPSESTHGSKSSTAPMLKKVPGTIRHQEADIPDPPSGIGLDIGRLIGIWDDSWPSWKNISPLVIKGQSIPLKHFHSIYIGSCQWKHLKQNWSKWNFLMSEYKLLGSHDFWEKWSSDGKRYTPSDILKGLAEERKKKEKEGAKAAKEAHPNGFQQAFSYRKGRKTTQLTSEKGIARRFWQLQKV
ncbi:hypothetical protein F5887DRAFT_1079040 [Amanita rubescens]|nr:hypothetical protein F5887DRAFT_1079040 [Amanita rubescens]